MAITDAEYQAIFASVGSLIRGIDRIREASVLSGPHTGLRLDVSTYDTNPNEGLLALIRIAFEAEGRSDVFSGTDAIFRAIRDALAGVNNTMAGKIEQRLSHRETIVDPLPNVTDGSDISDILRSMYRDMQTPRPAGETAMYFTPSVAAFTDDFGTSLGNPFDEPNNPPTGAGRDPRRGNGVLIITDQLDGVETPRSNGFNVPRYVDLATRVGVKTELVSPGEALTVTCTSDNDTDGVPIGFEDFLLQGQSDPQNPHGWREPGHPTDTTPPFDPSEGSGADVSFQTTDASNIVANREFEAWTANVPASWTIDDGVAGTNIIEETASADVHRGSSALSYVGTGVDIQISQQIPIGLILPNRAYRLGVWIKGDAGITNGTLTIQFESPTGGYTANDGTGGTNEERVQLLAADLNVGPTASDYTFHHFLLIGPNDVPDDLELVIKWIGSSGGTVRLDSLAFGEVTYGAGFGVNVFAGSNAFFTGDRFAFSVTNNEGLFQRFFRRQYGMQMPSAGATLIPDTLAT